MSYDGLKASGLYRAFLRHRVWAWRKALQTWPLFAIFPIGTVMVVWWVGTALPAILAASMIGNLLGLDTAMPALLMVAGLAHLIALGPIYITLLGDFFKDYSAHVALTFGNPAAAKARLRQVETDLSGWDGAHA